MSGKLKYPREWRQQVPAVVFACAAERSRIVLRPGDGLADGGTPRDVPVEQIPAELRMPNTPLSVCFDDKSNIVRVWRRDES